MFTGIVEEIGEIKTINQGQVIELVIDCPITSKKANLGDSISVNGVCLTVTKINNDLLSFNAVRETMERTCFREFRVGTKVNLETALTLNKFIGGHLVSGHIDGIGKISNIVNIGDSKEITFVTDKNILKYIVEKGSVCIDGISLTVASVNSESFKIAVIPHTLNNTILNYKNIGSNVNIENDIIGKYVERLLNKDNEKSLMDLLTEGGF